jgi:AraC-like DNA-binding protein
MSIVYRTTDVQTAQRFDYWHDVVCRHCVPAASRIITRDPFVGQLDARDLGVVGINRMSAPQHHWARDGHHLRKHPKDDFWLACLHDGEVSLAQDGRHAAMRGGDMVLYDAGRAFEATMSARAVYLVRIPRRSLLQRYAKAERVTACVIDATRPGAVPLRSILQEAAAVEFSPHQEAAAARFGGAIIDLLAVTLELLSDEAFGALTEQGLYARLLDYIRRHLDDPALSLEGLAQAHHVSARTVARAFARQQETAMGAVWRTRLQACHAALVEGRAATVTDAAFRHGFSDLSHFSRTFRRTYGCAPHTLLRSR